MRKKLYTFEINKSFTLFILSFCFLGFSFGQNPIVIENANAGTPATVWDIPGGTAGDLSIQGFATDISVNVGGTIDFKVDVNSGTDFNFNISIYRIGYYQGNGARLIADLGNFVGIAQPACNFDNVTGLTDCGNWTLTASWPVPATAVSGIYIAKLTRSVAGGGGSSHIAFIVRNDASTASLFFKTSDATWQAYNPYGGMSLYVGAGMPFNHANKVSYNRPFLTRSGGGGGGAQEDWFMNAEYPMIRFLEANGFDISYTTDVDISRNPTNLILNHQVFLSVGHDEYWSKEERNAVEAAKTAGKHLAFFSGNESYWKTRWENSNDGTNTPFRTMVCYKEGSMPTPGEHACGGKCDPDPEWTGLWRDGCAFPAGNACKPENALSGQISWDGLTGTIHVPGTYNNLRFWRNTPVAALGTGFTLDLTPGTLGFEWDWEQPAFQTSYPLGRVTMSKTSFDGHIHLISLYKTSNGALIFGAGSVQWAWGLDANHDRGIDPADLSMQQATINLLADMGVQPDPTAVLEPGLILATAYTDVTPSTSVITGPANGEDVPKNLVATITGTAVDAGGGVVAGVDISVDGGLTWQPAQGTTNWVFYWTPTVAGPANILTRAFDDIGNLEPQGTSGMPNNITLNVVEGGPVCPCTIFTPAQGPDASGANNNDAGQAISLGVKFMSSRDGSISGIRFFRAISDNAPSGTELVQLYSVSPDGVTPGTLLGQAALTTSASPGWTEVSFASPIGITANTVYVASYFSPTGFYTSTDNYFGSQIIHGLLTALADSIQSPNGLYMYGPAAQYPFNSFSASNYWVDVVFSPTVPLPVTYTNFKVTKEGNDALLTWTTSMEQNNTGFEIQRSNDGTSNWVVIGFVKSQGNNKSLQNYQYRDKDLSAGKYYYRLRQVDFDGKSTFTAVREVDFDGNSILELRQNTPNPFSASTTIVIVIPQAGRYKLTLYDQMGRSVRDLMDDTKGSGTYQIQLNKSGLSPGTYYYKLDSKDHSLVRKMTIF